MRKELFEKLKESTQSVLPVSGILLLLHLTIAPMPMWTFLMFLAGVILFIIGMSIFSMGADTAMMPIGEAIGAELTKTKKLWLIIISAFLLGVVVTIAEPDLQVLTKQVPAVPDMTLVIAVAAGVGVFLVLALLRILFQFSLSRMFLIAYSAIFLLAAIAAPDFLGLAIDAGGVTTGPVTVPFILAMGAGISSVRGGRNVEEDSFGLCALCSIGPIFAVLILGIFFDTSGSGFAFEAPQDIHSLTDLFRAYGEGIAGFFQEVLTVLLPIVVIFVIFQLARLKMARTRVIRILIGVVYTLIGLTVMLAGVNIGFLPAGTHIGRSIAELPYNWILLPLSALLGFVIVYAEPAVHMLNKQVEEITSGAIPRKMMMTGLSIAVSAALLMSVLRILFQLNIWFFLLPGYVLALVLTFFTPKIFTAIAFDSGGVAAGTMTAAFLLPFAVGICEAVGGNIMTDAFGIVAMTATMPLITIQVIGVIYSIKLKRAQAAELLLDEELDDDMLFTDEEADSSQETQREDADRLETSEREEPVLQESGELVDGHGVTDAPNAREE